MSRVGVDAMSEADCADVTEESESVVDGRTRRWEAHRASRRDELTRLARKAIHRGGADLSMDEIAAAIGTSKSIVYRYFTDRSGLQTAVGEAVLADLGGALVEATRGVTTPPEAIRAMVAVYLEMVSTSPSVYAFVTRGSDVSDVAAPMRTLADDTAALLVPVLTSVLADQHRGEDLARVWAAGIIGFVRGAAEVWLVDPQNQAPLTDLIDPLTDWICHGTGPHPRERDLSDHTRDEGAH